VCIYGFSSALGGVDLRLLYLVDSNIYIYNIYIFNALNRTQTLNPHHKPINPLESTVYKGRNKAILQTPPLTHSHNEP